MEDINVYAIPGFREPFSCFTHLFAVPVFAVLGYFLVVRGRGTRVRTASLTVLASTTVFLLSMSAVYHLFGPGTGRYVMQQLDVAGVFALIAGTVTPVHVILFRGFNRWAPLVLVWSAAATGITLRTIFSARLPMGVGTAIFLLMGWGGLISCILLWRRYGFLFVKPLLAGGVAYTLGAIILSLNWPTLIHGVIEAHELWHVAVLVGLGFHWKFIFQFADGLPHAKVAKLTTRRLVSKRAPTSTW
jgi:channel protein (hemolysin III family)